jgi:hypothetical protein
MPLMVIGPIGVAAVKPVVEGPPPELVQIRNLRTGGKTVLETQRRPATLFNAPLASVPLLLCAPEPTTLIAWVNGPGQ